MEAKRAFCLWSGGKDSHLAFMEAQSQGYDIALALTFFDARTRSSLSHRLPPRVLRDQARLAGVYLQEVYVGREEYEQRLRAIMQSLAPQKINYAIFGDIHLEEHRVWNERVCNECGVTPVFPLWGWSTEVILEKQHQFRSLIVAVETGKLHERWLGQAVDHEFHNELRSKGLDLLGEHGEYHTLVVQSPAMKGQLQVERWKKQAYDSYVGLDIQEWSVLQSSPITQEVVV
ncbi:MAG TPA: hypothetical protein VNL36_05300 [Bacteroidota bacterium]|nr:hypothetical protein [Bacteroidota bacterium]